MTLNFLSGVLKTPLREVCWCTALTHTFFEDEKFLDEIYTEDFFSMVKDDLGKRWSFVLTWCRFQTAVVFTELKRGTDM